MADDKAKTEEKDAVELKGDSKKIADMLEKMTVLELSELVKGLEDKFGVSASAPVAAVAAPAAGAGDAAEAEEKTSFDVILTDAGGQKIQVIKVVKAAAGLGLKEAKELVDSAPKAIKEGASKDEAEELKKQVEEAGGSVELK